MYKAGRQIYGQAYGEGRGGARQIDRQTVGQLDKQTVSEREREREVCVCVCVFV